LATSINVKPEGASESFDWLIWQVRDDHHVITVALLLCASYTRLTITRLSCAAYAQGSEEDADSYTDSRFVKI